MAPIQSQTKSGEGGSGILWWIGGAVVAFLVIRALIDRQRRKEAILRACAFFNSAGERGEFQPRAVSLNLQSGEIGLFEAIAGLSEMRTHRYSTGGRVRVAKGLWVNTTRSHSYQRREIIDRGRVVITNQRIAFSGAVKTANVWFSDLISIEGGFGHNVIHTERRQSVVSLHYDDALIGLFLVRVASSGVLSGSKLSREVHLRAAPTTDGWLRLSLGDTAAALAS